MGFKRFGSRARTDKHAHGITEGPRLRPINPFSAGRGEAWVESDEYWTVWYHNARLNTMPGAIGRPSSRGGLGFGAGIPNVDVHCFVGRSFSRLGDVAWEDSGLSPASW